MKKYIDFTDKYTSIKLIILYFLIFSTLVTVIFKKNIKNYVDSNWSNVRCKPYMFPFIGLSKYAKGNTYFDKSMNTFNSCTDTIILNIIKITSNPFTYLAHLITDILNKFINIIKVFKTQSVLLRKIFKSIIKNTTGRIEDNMSTALYLHEKLKNIIKKQNAMIEITKHFLSSFPVLLYSFSHGPIPRFANWLSSYINMLSSVLISCMLCNFSKRHCIRKDTCPICALCFEGETPIQIDNYINKPINQLKINDKIKGGLILGIIKLKDMMWDLYEYNNIILSGSHLVYEHRWIRIENSCHSKPISRKCSLICLITSSHEIYIKNIKFKDYQETEDLDILNQINYNVLKSCNHNKLCIKTKFDINHTYAWGFDENTLVKINDTYEAISDIINNQMYTHNIIGFTTIKVTNERFFNIDGIVTTGTSIVKLDNIWQRVHQSNHQPIANKIEYIYNLITRDNTIEIQGKNKSYLFRDYVENFDNELNDSIDKLIEDRLNHVI